MNLRSTRLLSAFALVLALPAMAADTYKIDAVHSSVGFQVDHLVVATVTGRFAKFDGAVVVDASDFTKSSVDVTIDTASITTDNEGRDKHLRSHDYFDVATFPTITFKSSAVKEVSKGHLEVTGTFTMHGIAKTIVLPITNRGTHTTPQGTVAGFKGAITVKRSEYGITSGIPAVGDEVEIALNIEAHKVEAK